MENTLPYDSFPEAVAAARTKRKSGDLEGAADIYRRVPSAFPDKKNAVTTAADGLKDCGFWTEAVGMLEAALEKWPQSALYLSSLAEMYRLIGDHDRAASYIQRYLDHDSRNPEAWIKLARLHDMAGNHIPAEAAYRSALDRDPTNTQAIIGRGDSLFQLGRVEDAIASYRRAVATSPQDAGALFALGSALMTQGAEGEGHGYLRQSLEINSQNARAHVNLGLTYFNTGNVKEAETAARNALIIDDQLQIAHVLLGLALTEGGDVENAAVALSKAVASGVHNTEALFAHASLQISAGNKFAAELALHRILTEAPQDAEARHLLDALHGAAISEPHPDYSRVAFDRIAPRFDNQEMRLRNYRVPAEITDLIEAYEPDRRTVTRLLDAGCGTGLVAAALHEAFAIEHSVGIDVSPKMTKIAHTRGLYSQIIVGDVLRDLEALDGTFDIITAGDLFPYLGGLQAFIAAARLKLTTGGLLAYSIELSDAAPLVLAQSGRFVHTLAYVEDCARAASLRPVASREIILRRAFGRDVPGIVGLLQA